VERLIELVAASFARNGIECPVAADLRSAGPVAMASAETMPNTAIHTTEATVSPTFSAMLPEHNFRKGQQGDPAP
jgi:hypothetical protein